MRVSTPAIGLILYLLCAHSQAKYVIEFDHTKAYVNPSPHVYYLKDESGNWTINEIQNRKKTWHAIESAYPAFGYDNQAAYWLTFELQNTSTWQADLLLTVEYAILNNVHVFIIKNNVIISHFVTGNLTPFDTRPINNENFLFPLTLSPGEKTTVFIRVKTETAVQIPISLWNREHYFTNRQPLLLGQGLYFGVMLAMALYNGFIYLSVRQKHYLNYVVSVFSLILFMASIRGFGYQFLWPNFPSVNTWIITFSISIFGASASAFSISILRLKHYSKVNYQILTILSYVFSAIATLSFFLPYRTVILFLVPLCIFGALIGLTTGTRMFLKGYKPARYYVLAFGSLLTGAIIMSLNKLSWIPANLFTENSMQIGSLIDVIFLSFALANRINTEKNKRLIAQRDLSKIRLRMHEENFAQQKKLIIQQTRAKAKDEFLSTMSHEIRTPMNGVVGIIQILKTTQLNDEQINLIRIMEGSSETLLSVINDILDFSKIHAGKMRIESIRFDLRHLLAELEQLYTMNVKLNKRVTFSISFEEELPQFVKGDPIRIKQILTNLLNNAFKFTHTGNISLTIKSHLELITFSVTDTGIGVQEEKIATLFEQYSQTQDSISREYGGTGLGLSICKQLTQLMNGEIGVSSRPEKGSTFWVCLPLPTCKTEPSNSLTNKEFNPSFSNLFVLIVEDNLVNQMVINKLLKSLGVSKIEIVENGAEALTRFEELISEQNAPDLILMDCQMPIMDGFETTQAIRKVELFGKMDPTPIIALTANTGEQTVERCRAVGMNAHIGKPVTINELKLRMNEVWANN